MTTRIYIEREGRSEKEINKFPLQGVRAEKRILLLFPTFFFYICVDLSAPVCVRAAEEQLRDLRAEFWGRGCGAAPLVMAEREKRESREGKGREVCVFFPFALEIPVEPSASGSASSFLLILFATFSFVGLCIHFHFYTWLSMFIESRLLVQVGVESGSAVSLFPKIGTHC